MTRRKILVLLVAAVILIVLMIGVFAFCPREQAADDVLGKPTESPLPSRTVTVRLRVVDPAGQLLPRFRIEELVPRTVFAEKEARENPCPVEFNRWGFGFSWPSDAEGRKERRYRLRAYGFVPETVAIEEADTLANREEKQEITVRLRPCPPGSADRVRPASVCPGSAPALGAGSGRPGQRRIATAV